MSKDERSMLADRLIGYARPDIMGIGSFMLFEGNLWPQGWEMKAKEGGSTEGYTILDLVNIWHESEMKALAEDIVVRTKWEDEEGKHERFWIRQEVDAALERRLKGKGEE